MELSGFDLLNWKSVAMVMPILCTLLLLANALRQSTERRSVIWLTLFVIAAAITSIPMIIGFAGAYDRWPDLTFLPTDLSFFFGPLLYFHGHSLMLRHIQTWPSCLWMVPGACHLLYQFLLFFAFSSYEAKWEYAETWHDPYISPALLIIGAGLAITAFVRINQLRKHYLARLAQRQSNELQFDVVWFTHLSKITPVLLGIWLVFKASDTALTLSYDIVFWFDLLCLFGLFVLVAEATNRLQRTFPKMDEESIPPLDRVAGQSAKNWQEEGIRIRDTIMKERWFLQPDLSISDLSQNLGTNQTYVSKAFNLGLRQSFSFAVNSMRVDYAKTLIEDGGFSLLEVSNVAGFGSKSSFNRAFTTHAQQSPSAYKASLNTMQNQKIDKFS